MNQTTELDPIQEAEEIAELEAIQDLNHFYHLLQSWHDQAVAIVEHFLEIPEGTPIQLGQDGKEIVLEGDAHVAFQAGLITALANLGNLPFHAMEDDPDEAIH